MYIELFLLDNFVMDCLLLRMAAAFCGAPLSARRMCAAAFAGACFAWAALFYPLLLSLPGKAGAGLLLALALPFDGRRGYLRAAAAVFAAAFLSGGLAFCLASCLGGSMKGSMIIASTPLRAALVAALLLSFAPRIIRRLRARRAALACRMALTVRAGGREYALDALLDTGNALYDPLSGLPVIVAYLPKLRPLAEIPIPMSTAAGEALLLALRPEQIRIGGREHAALIALSPAPLKGADALLPCALLEFTAHHEGGTA